MKTPENLPCAVSEKFVRKTVRKREYSPDVGELYVVVFHPVKGIKEGLAFLGRINQVSVDAGRIGLSVYLNSQTNSPVHPLGDKPFNDGFMYSTASIPMPGHFAWGSAYLLDHGDPIGDELREMVEANQIPTEPLILV